MKTKIYLHDFCKIIEAEPDCTFSYDAMRTLFDHLERMDPNMDLEANVIINGWTEATLDELVIIFEYEYDKKYILEDIAEETVILDCENGNYIFRHF